jgi:daunorubicin resistance ABC transporter membrane protein
MAATESVVAAESPAPPVEATRPSQLRLNLATIAVLWSRDLRRFFRQRSRVVGALVQPLIFWLVIGSGFDKAFLQAGGYRHFFFPGILLLIVLFTSIFTTMSVIEDRHKGFLQAVLVAPASRASLVLGKTLGGVTIALVQSALFLALVPLAGYSPLQIDWPLLFGALLLASIGLSALGFGIAWWLDSTQGYHVIMSVLLIPLWILSGALFPVEMVAVRWLEIPMRLNPMTYAVSTVRDALRGGGATPWTALAVLAGFAIVATAWATFMCSRRGAKP